MDFKKASLENAQEILKIVQEAKEYFRENDIDQWQGEYPNLDVVINDIKNENSYIMIEDNKIIAIAAIFFEEDESYRVIKNGCWLSDNEYITIHRIAVTNDYKGKGIAQKVIYNAKDIAKNKGILSIRIDTHKENIGMRKLLEKTGFSYCGDINVHDGTKRLAYEIIIK